MLNKSRTEIIVSDPQMYQYMFRRIADIDMLGATGPAAPATQKPAAWDNYGAQPYQAQPKGYATSGH